MRLWRVSSSPWERPQQSTPWFNARTASIAIYHASPLAAICARLLERRLPYPALMPDTDRLHSVEVGSSRIQMIGVSRYWHVNPKETREIVLAWRAFGKAPVLCVPSMSGAKQYLIDTRSPWFASIRVYRSDARPFKRSLHEAHQHLAHGAEWLVP